MKWEFEEKSGARICRATSMPYGTYLMYCAIGFFLLGFMLVAAGGDNKAATAFGAIFIVCSAPVFLLSLFTKNPVTEISVKEGSLTAHCVYRFSEKETIMGLDKDPKIVRGWYSNPIFFTPGGPDGGKGIYRMELVSNDSEMIELGQSQSPQELDEAAKRMNAWLLERPDAQPAPGSGEALSEEIARSMGLSASGIPTADGIPQGPPIAASGMAMTCIIIGMLSVVWGGLQYKASLGSSQVPIACDLARLEAGEALPDIHIELGEHLAVYTESIVSTRSISNVNEDTSVEWVKYPVISRRHPFFKKLKPVAKKYGGIEKIPENKWPSIDSFAVLVLSREFKTCGEIPDKMEKFKSVKGLVINQVSSLTSTQEQLIKKHFPKVDPHKIWVLEKGRRPWKTSSAVTLVGIGVIFLVIAGVVAVRAAKK